MKTKILIAVLIFIGLGGYAVAQGDGTEENRMDTSAFETLRRPPALFDHDGHNEKAGLEDDCGVCHHVWENGRLVEDETSEDSPCSECHGLTPGPDNSMSLSNAFHTQCRSCHIDTGKGPLLCGQCHKKMKGESK